MAADYNFTPDHGYKGRIKVEKTTINDLEDHSEIRLEAGESLGGEYSERYRLSGADLVSMLAFFKTRRLVVPFTKLTYDPGDVGFDPDDPASVTGPIETVRFMAEPTWRMSFVDDYSVTCKFKKLVNE
ncbi:MAG: hypothetical protein V3S82_10420 [Dehalococcoidia bacterium]